MSRGSGLPSRAETVEFAAYVAGITSELSRLARTHNLPTLAYLLDIARLEAAGEARNVPGEENPQPEQNRRSRR